MVWCKLRCKCCCNINELHLKSTVMLISIVCWNNIYVQHLYLLLLTCLVFLIKYWTPVIVCNVDYICIGLKLSLLMLASYYVHRNPNWSRETCSSFPWISNVVKLLKRMPLHLPRSKFVWCMMHIIILIFKGFILLLLLNKKY